MPDAPGNVVIVGGDTCATSVAAYIANSLGGMSPKITLLDDMSSHGDSSSTLPATVEFCRLLRFDEKSLVTGTGSTFKLGTEHAGWLRKDKRFLHSYGVHGMPIRLLPFHQYLLKARLAGDPIDFEEYSLASMAMRSGRFAYPSMDPASVQSTLAYGLHVDSHRFAEAMLRHARALGVQHVAATVRSATVQSDSGFVESVTLDDGTVLDGDFFIDCSGERAILIGDALEIGYQSWADALPCDRCAHVSIDDVRDLSPTTRVVAKENGWSRRVQLLERADFEFFYNADITNDNEVAMRFQRDVGASEQPRYRHIRSGRRASFWHGNCIAIGRSAGDFESLGVSNLSCAHAAVKRLMSLWPYSDCEPVISQEYNRLAGLEYEQTRDFIALFYALSDRDDTTFWKHCRSLRIPERLDQRLSLYRSHGRLSWDAGDAYSRDDWLSILFGLECIPRNCDPLVDVADPTQVKELLDQLRCVIRQAVDRMPRHEVFLEKLHQASGQH